MATGTRARGGNGKFTRTAASIKRDHRAAELRGQGWSYARIAAELGFAHKGKAHEAVTRAFADIPTEESAGAKVLDLERIDRLIEWNWAVMLREHVAHSNGKVVGRLVGVERNPDGTAVLDSGGAAIPVYEDILDDGPGQASAKEIRALIERRAKVFGYDAPTRSRIEVVTEEDLDAELAGVLAANARMEAEQREAADADPGAD